MRIDWRIVREYGREGLSLLGFLLFYAVIFYLFGIVIIGG